MGGENGILTELLFILLLVSLNAFFAASEIAIISVNRKKIEYIAENDSKAKLLLNFIDKPSRFLATIQVGITVAGFLASASAAVSISKILADLLKGLRVSFITPASDEIAVVVVTVILSFITLVLGELLPKRVALENAEGIALFSAKPINIFSIVMKPFVTILTVSTNFLARLLGAEGNEAEDKVTEEEIKMMIDVGKESGVLNQTEKDMINGIFKFDDILAKQIMTPRTKVFALDINTPIEEITKYMIERQYSKIPVYKNNIDNILGILHMKDLFFEVVKGNIKNISIENLIKPAYFVPETKYIDVLFRELQSKKEHIAILIDEYGGFAGLITMDDLIEEIMGNISDEYDKDLEYIEKLGEGEYLVAGLVPIHDVNDVMELDIPLSNFDTIGGFVIDLLNDIPSEGDKPVVEFRNIVFEVQKVKGKRIESVKISKKQHKT